jgi:hypothetical protein
LVEVELGEREASALERVNENFTSSGFGSEMEDLDASVGEGRNAVGFSGAAWAFECYARGLKDLGH